MGTLSNGDHELGKLQNFDKLETNQKILIGTLPAVAALQALPVLNEAPFL